MTASETTHFGFTKLVVGNLDGVAAFYTNVCDLKEIARVDAEIDGRRIREIIFTSSAGAMNFILLAFLDEPKPHNSEVILGMTTPNAQAFVDRAIAAGGSLIEAVHTTHQMGQNITVAFVADSEGHMIEVVQMV